MGSQVRILPGAPFISNSYGQPIGCPFLLRVPIVYRSWRNADSRLSRRLHSAVVFLVGKRMTVADSRPMSCGFRKKALTPYLWRPVRLYAARVANRQQTSALHDLNKSFDAGRLLHKQVVRPFVAAAQADRETK